MSVQYTADIRVDLGERIHLKSEVCPVCEQDINFTIKSARYELWNSRKELEDSGTCAIEGHNLDALISPLETGVYKFKYIYEIADEVWVDVIRMVVS